MPNNRYGQNHPKQQAFVSSVVENLIIQGKMALHTVETPWFQRFIGTLDDKLICPTVYKIKSGIKQLFKNKHDQLTNKLRDIPWVSITLDLWSDRRMRSFMGITVHFLDSAMKLYSFLIFLSLIAIIRAKILLHTVYPNLITLVLGIKFASLSQTMLAI